MITLSPDTTTLDAVAYRRFTRYVRRGMFADRRPLLAIAILISLGGCAVGPDYRGAPDLSLPTHWTNGAGNKLNRGALGRWWERLRDPLLNRLIEEAISANPTVHKARAAVQEARATLAQTSAAVFPSVSGSGSATDNKTSSATNSTNGVSLDVAPYAIYQSGLDASWELDLFGGNHRSVEAAFRSAQSAEEDLRYSLVTLLGDVVAYYIDARGYLARIALARQTSASQRDTQRLTRSKYEAGSGTAVDLAKATAQAASTEANIPTYEAALAADVHRLSILLGRHPGAISTTLTRSAEIPRPKLPLPLGLPADLLTNRPDVASAERKLAQTTAKIGQAEADRYPSVSLTGSISTSALRLGDLAKYSSVSWSVGPSITVPIFDAAKRQAAVRVAEAQRDESFAEFQSTLLTALEDVENSLVSLSTERVRIRKLSEASTNYRLAARLSRSLFETGSATFLDVLDAERSLYSAEDSLIQSKMSLAKDYVSLAKALGGGDIDPGDVSTPLITDTNTGPHLRAVVR